MHQKSSFPLQIRTALPISTCIGTEILNLAVHGSCDSWAVVSEIEPAEANTPFCKSARFSVRTNPSCSLVLDSDDVLHGVELMLSSEYKINEDKKRLLLQVVLNNSAGELDHELAGSIMMAAMRRKTHPNPDLTSPN